MRSGASPRTRQRRSRSPSCLPGSIPLGLARRGDTSQPAQLLSDASLFSLEQSFIAAGLDEARRVVDALLGRPESISQKNEGTLSVSVSTYRKNGRVINAEFVEGVLVRYTIRSQ